MSYKNKRLVKKVIKDFSDNSCSNYINYLDDNIKWNIIGMPAIMGKREFINAINSLEIKNFTLSKIKNIISEGEFVVIESSSQLNMKSIENDSPSYCDIYRIINNKICELTTYIVDTSVRNDKYELLN